MIPSYTTLTALTEAASAQLAPLLSPLACNVTRTGPTVAICSFRAKGKTMRALATASQTERLVGEPSHFTDRTPRFFCWESISCILGRRITQIFGDRKFACDKIAGGKSCMTCNGHISSPFPFQLLNGNFHPHISAALTQHPGPLIATLIELNCSSARQCPLLNV